MGRKVGGRGVPMKSPKPSDGPSAPSLSRAPGRRIQDLEEWGGRLGVITLIVASGKQWGGRQGWGRPHPRRRAGRLAGPVAGVRWGGVAWKLPCRALGAIYVTQKCDWAQREREGTFQRTDKIPPLRLHGVSVSLAPQESAGRDPGC